LRKTDCVLREKRWKWPFHETILSGILQEHCLATSSQATLFRVSRRGAVAGDSGGMTVNGSNRNTRRLLMAATGK
jgi:hypothetical protein